MTEGALPPFHVSLRAEGMAIPKSKILNPKSEILNNIPKKQSAVSD